MSYSLEQLETDSAHSYTAKTSVEHVISLLKAERRDLMAILAYAVAIGILSLVVPIAVQILVNYISFGTIYQPVVILAIIVFSLLCLASFTNLMQILLVELLQRRLFVRVALDLAVRIPRFNMLVFRTEWPSDLLNRFFEIALVQKTVSKLLLDGIALVLQVATGLLILSCYHPLLLVFVLLLLGIFLVIIFPLGSGSIRSSMAESSAKHTVLIWLQNLAAHPLLFRSQIGQSYGFQRADQVTANYIIARQQHFKILFRQKIGLAIMQTCASAALLGLGGLLVLEQQLTLGQLVAAEIIVTGVLQNLAKVGHLLESFYDLVASISKLDSLIELQVEDGHGEVFETSTPLEVRLEDITSKFSDDYIVFDSLNLHIKPNDKIAVLGKNGTGKSLLADLILKFHEPNSGKIILNGDRIEDLAPLSIRGPINLIRHVEAFRGSISDNLRMGRELPSYELRNILTGLGLHEDIDRLKDGLNTWLREDGSPLTGGQMVRLMLARALLMKPKMIIIDALLDALDEELVKDTVSPMLLDLNCSVCVMTHDPRVADLFPSSYELANGKLHRR